MSGAFADLAGRRALVTGSSRGIGRAIALALAAAGARIALHGSRPSEALDSAAAEIRVPGGEVQTFVADLADQAATARMASGLEAAWGGIDLLILNASHQERTPWHAIDRDAFDRQMRINVWSPLQLIQAFAPGMCARSWGRIITVGSVQQARPHPDMAVYAASKSALFNLTRNLARQLAPHGVRVNQVAPGVIDTDRNSEALADPAYREQVVSRIPAGRIGAPGEITGTVCFLCSDAAEYVTGTNLMVDGGFTL
jgi:glucose 1-dehydrogenase